MYRFFSLLNFSFIMLVSSIIILKVINLRKKLMFSLSEFILKNILLLFFAFCLLWNQAYIKSLKSEWGWESGFHKTVASLTGNNVDIVPVGEKGYVIDNTYESKLIDSNAYINQCIKTLKVKKGEILQASVFCFVSKDFNGDSVKILIKGAVHGNSESYYRIFTSRNDNLELTKNLIYNGNFELGKTNWTPYADSTTHTIIETPFGKGIRVSRGNGNGGDWSLRYVGRPIIYYAGHTYQIKFIFKVQKGISIPFYIGWWVDTPNYGFALPLKIRDLEDGWKEAICSYKFKETNYDLPTFLNTLLDFSIVDIAKVEMTDLNRIDTVPHFVDQLSKIGTWQKLQIDVPCDQGKALFYICVSKNGVSDFTSLKGSVVFARPEYKLIAK
jgi:hypothetical protein